MTAALLCIQVGAWQECHSDRDGAVTRLVSSTTDMIAEKILGNVQHDSGAVAGLAIGIYGAPMPQSLERLDSRLDNITAGSTVNGSNKTYATGVRSRRVNSRFTNQPVKISLILLDRAFAPVLHPDPPSQAPTAAALAVFFSFT